MIGAMIGDIAGSRFEFHNIKSKEFAFIAPPCEFTDDTVMTAAIAKTLLETRGGSDGQIRAAAVRNRQDFGKRYPHRGYGGRFGEWIYEEDPKPYRSFGNGAGMRVSPVGYLAQDEEELKRLSRLVTEVTHDHPEGIKGAEAIALCILMARQGKSKEEIRARMIRDYYPQIGSEDLLYENLLREYSWDYGVGSVSCQDSVPEAIVCFLASESFEDAIRTAISIGGDSDTIACMTGGIAEAYYGFSSIDREILDRAFAILPKEFLEIMLQLYAI